jgi:tRNA (cmo5U34)-methyltransferase
MAEFAWDPESYLPLMQEEVPDYPRLQQELVRATDGEVGSSSVRRILDLGIGSGLTAAQVLEAHPEAYLTGVDASEAMLEAAHASLDPERTDLLSGRLEEALPEGPFDLVISSLAVHHLDGPGKAELFSRIAAVLAPGGRFVLADLVAPPDPADVVTPIDGIEDTPSSLDDQLGWLQAAGLDPEVTWHYRDLAVVRAVRAVLSGDARTRS